MIYIHPGAQRSIAFVVFQRQLPKTAPQKIAVQQVVLPPGKKLPLAVVELAGTNRFLPQW